MLVEVLSYGIGTVIGFALIVVLVFVFVRDVTQKRHSVLRSYPVVGRLRFFFEQLGEYFRQYLFMGDREEMPFNRATRAWVYRLAKNEGGTIGFGSTYDINAPGALVFVNHPFPVLEEERLPTPPLVLGEGFAREPFEARSIVNVSGMSYGAISAPAVRALSRGAAVAGCWLDTGEGGLSPYHLEGGCDLIMQIGTAKYGARDAEGNLSPERLLELARVVKAFEIKLSQGAKPGKGGVLPAKKVTAEIARIRGIPEGRDSISPNRHRDISNMAELLDKVAWIRDLTGRPVGVKTAIGGWRFLHELAEQVHRRGLEFAPDFLVVDGGEGGSGAAPQALADHMSLSIKEALPRVVDALIEAGLRQRIRVVASGKLVTPAQAAWGARGRRRFREHRARLHVRPRLHPGAALPPEHLSHRRHDAQQAAAARARGRGKIPARRELRAQHEPRDRHDRALVRRSARARAAPRARAHRAGEPAVGRAEHALSVSRAKSARQGGLRARG
ncbi:MAG: FMN-binding glutamate synthase family protein [Burkholderiales bacterium]|nr:FMN-binding glutamate synthase family protein [Burkholderiales bacterium]